MEIGKEEPAKTIEPVKSPVPANPTPRREPAREPVKTPAPEKVPA